MILFPFCDRTILFKVSILIQLFFSSSSTSLQIHHTDLHPSLLNRSTISVPQLIYPDSNPISSPMPTNPQKKLRRLPHVFSRVLELPLRSHADVFIEDRSDCYRFVANIQDNVFSGQVRAHAVKIHPEVTKVVVRGENGGGGVDLFLDKLEVDVWRFRLPATTRPELATAVVVGSELIVTVPKGGRSSHGVKVEDGRDGGRGRLISVQ